MFNFIIFDCVLNVRTLDFLESSTDSDCITQVKSSKLKPDCVLDAYF